LNSIPQPAHEQFLDWLADRLAALLRENRRAGRQRLLSIGLRLPGLRLSTCPRLRTGDFYWSAPAGGHSLLGRGRAWHRQFSGPQRLQQADRALRALRPRWQYLHPDGPDSGPLLLTAAAFDADDPMEGGWSGFPNTTLFAPRLLLEQGPRGCRLILSRPPGTADGDTLREWLELLDGVLQDSGCRDRHVGRSSPGLPTIPDDAANWLSLSRRAIETIGQGKLDKLVLYRRLRLPADLQCAGALLETLHGAFPDCRLIAFHQGDSVFVCASPEQLLAKRGRAIASDALAGTAPLDSESGNGEDLRRHAKSRHEQALVQTAVRQALAPLCSELTADRPPRVRPLGQLMHLHNRIQGLLREETAALQLAARLHPTPAVCGSPTQAAMDWLRREGQSRRGWYSGFAGWIGRNGDAELNVLLRCALLGRDGTELFAGAGLVAGSRAEDELAETELKLAAVGDHLRP
jgi:isochorismate synthase